MNVTVISAGERANIIPDAASAQVNVRVRNTGGFRRAFKRCWRRTRQHVTVPGTSVSVSREPAFPPLPDNPGTKALAARAQAIYAGIGRKLETGGNGGASESALAAEAGVPALDGLGPVGGGFHSDREYPRPEFRHAAALSADETTHEPQRSTGGNENASWELGRLQSVAVALLGEQRIEHFRLLRRTQLFASRLIAQQPRHARQRLQMIGAGILRRQQQKHEIHRLIVDRIVSNRCLQPREHADDVRQPRQPAMRDRDTLPHPRRTEALAFRQRLENAALRQTGELGRTR